MPVIAFVVRPRAGPHLHRGSVIQAHEDYCAAPTDDMFRLPWRRLGLRQFFPVQNSVPEVVDHEIVGDLAHRVRRRRLGLSRSHVPSSPHNEHWALLDHRLGAALDSAAADCWWHSSRCRSRPRSRESPWNVKIPQGLALRPMSVDARHSSSGNMRREAQGGKS